ncbi:MAG: hypothetical protein AB7N91_22920 [Candidatus Tectimicrobiota bacterium]
MHCARTLLSVCVGMFLMAANTPAYASDPAHPNAGPGVSCTVCSSKLDITRVSLYDKLQATLVWDRPYIFGTLEPEFACKTGTIQEEPFLPASPYTVSHDAYCSFAPWPPPYNPGLNAYADSCGLVDQAQIDLALTYAGVWNHVRIEADQTVSIPVDYQTMSAVLLGNADPVEWAFDCAVWYSPQIRQSVATGSIHGQVNTTDYWQITVPRFPSLCQDRRFVVRAPAQSTARVYSILVNRRVCDPNAGEPEVAPQF